MAGSFRFVTPGTGKIKSLRVMQNTVFSGSVTIERETNYGNPLGTRLEIIFSACPKTPRLVVL
jgi:hypothetical protein